MGLSWPLMIAILLEFGGSPPAGGRTMDAAKVARGRKALLERAYLRGNWPDTAYRDLPKVWGEPTVAEQLDAQAYARYGLHPAPFPNDGFPMGLRRADDSRKRLVIDCLLCHGGSIAGQSYVGLPNVTLDFTGLANDLTRASGRPVLPGPFAANRMRGVTNAGAMGVFLLAMRNPDFSVRLFPLNLGWHLLPDLDAPAWWLLKKKSTMYCDGGVDATSTRSMMQFLLGLDRTRADMEELEPVWDDIRHYILSLEPPPYPFAIDRDLARTGQNLFANHCADCHGTYGPHGHYPNKVIPMAIIGTDKNRYTGLTDAAFAHYNATYYGEKHPARKTEGYQAPPLDGIWATAPYFHNGSVPTLYEVLKSSARPQRYQRVISTQREHYDARHVGWHVQREKLPKPQSAADRRAIFDSTIPGYNHGGHTFGDDLTEEERWAIIEYLKTL